MPISASAQTKNTLTTDLFLGQRVTLQQPQQGYRAGSDAVFLAAATPAKSGDKILDAGCGVGAASFCLAARVDNCSITGLDMQGDLIVMAQNNIALNDFARNIQFISGEIPTTKNAEPNSFDHVMTNPPFFENNTAATNPSHPIKQRAHIETISLQEWIRFCGRMLKPRGMLTLIHQTSRLDDIMVALTDGFGDITVFPLWPRAGEDSKRILVRARKGGKTPLKLTSGLVLHHADNHYTEAAENILRHGQGLEF